MIPFFSQQKKQKFDKRLIKSLPVGARSKERRRLVEEKEALLDAPPEEHTIYFVPSSKLLWDQQNSRAACPVPSEFSGKSKTRFATVSHENLEEFTEWLDGYGCNWQEQ